MLKRSLMAMGLAVLLAATAMAQQKPVPNENLPSSSLITKKDKLSYSLGMDLGHQFRRMSLDIDPALFLQGLKDALSGNKSAMSEEEIRKSISEMQNELQQRQQQMMADAGEKSKKEGQAFLAENKDKPGVRTLPSGLQYKVLKEGTGPKPTPTDTVVCNYRGTLVNGDEFDSSYKRGQPATFPVNGVIKGWTEALQLMPVGSKWQLFIPSELAYGERGVPGIGPNSTLVFEVELLSIQKK